MPAEVAVTASASVPTHISDLEAVLDTAPPASNSCSLSVSVFSDSSSSKTI